MNLQYLFEIQGGLAEHIEKEHPREEGEDRLSKKILALQVELGECANEWRGFKFWSNDQVPRTEVYYGPPELPDVGTYKNPLLEEYVDCLHFILDIGLVCQFEDGQFYTSHRETVTDQFNKLFSKVGDFSQYRTKGNYESIFCLFLALGEMLGFTWEQVEQAYLEKNKINHLRQVNGY